MGKDKKVKGKENVSVPVPVQPETEERVCKAADTVEIFKEIAAKKEEKVDTKKMSALQKALATVGRTESDIFDSRYVGAELVSIVTKDGRNLYFNLKKCEQVEKQAVYPKNPF